MKYILYIKYQFFYSPKMLSSSGPSSIEPSKVKDTGSSTYTTTTTAEAGENIWTEIKEMEDRCVRVDMCNNLYRRLLGFKTGTNEIEKVADHHTHQRMMKEGRWTKRGRILKESECK